MQGVTTHVSAPKINTDWTKALKKTPDTNGAAPSLTRILVNLYHTSSIFASFLTTSVQYSYVAEMTSPKYLKEFTISRGRPYALKNLDVTAFSSSASGRCFFCFTPFLHCAVHQCIPFNDRHGTSMSHRGHRGWGRLPSSSTTTVSLTCRCQNCTIIVVRVNARPLHPLTGQVLGLAFAGNTIL